MEWTGANDIVNMVNHSSGLDHGKEQIMIDLGFCDVENPNVMLLAGKTKILIDVYMN